MKKLILLIVCFTTLAINLPAANLTFSLSEEKNVNDIPFNTEVIAAEYLVNNTEFILEEEPAVDDIPFNTMCFLFDKASLCDVRAQQITRDSFTLILQLPGKEAFTFSNPEDFKKSFMKCVLETPPMEFRTCIQGIQHDFPQTLPSKR